MDTGYAQVGWGKKGLNAFDFKGQFEVVALGQIDILDVLDVMEFVDIINHSPPAVPPYCCHKGTCKTQNWHIFAPGNINDLCAL